MKILARTIRVFVWKWHVWLLHGVDDCSLLFIAWVVGRCKLGLTGLSDSRPFSVVVICGRPNVTSGVHGPGTPGWSPSKSSPQDSKSGLRQPICKIYINMHAELKHVGSGWAFKHERGLCLAHLIRQESRSSHGLKYRQNPNVFHCKLGGAGKVHEPKFLPKEKD